MPPTLPVPREIDGITAQIQKMETALEQVANPLRDVIYQTPYVFDIPPEWFTVAVKGAYNQYSRHFAGGMQLRDPVLLGTFMRADIGIILEGVGGSMRELCEFVRQKYGLGEECIKVVTNVPTIPRLLALSEEVMRRRQQGAIHEGRGHIGEEVNRPNGYSHIRPMGEAFAQPPTDWLLQEVHALNERLQSGGSYSHRDEQGVYPGSEQSEREGADEDYLTDEEVQ